MSTQKEKPGRLLGGSLTGGDGTDDSFSAPIITPIMTESQGAQARGFQKPTYTMIPNELLGNQGEPGYMADMGEAELRVTLAICRLTFGWHRRRVKATIGIIARMTGMSEEAVRNGAERAEARGLIRRASQHGRGLITQWEVIVCEEKENPNEDGVLPENPNEDGNKPQRNWGHERKLNKQEHSFFPDSSSESPSPAAGLPRAVDGQQRAVDAASGGKAPDPVEEVARHLRWGCMDAPVDLPASKREREPYLDAARSLLEQTDAGDVRGVCVAIDRWFESPPAEDEWYRDRAKKPNFALAQLAAYYHARQQGKAQTLSDFCARIPTQTAAPPPPSEAEVQWKRCLAILGPQRPPGDFAGTRGITRENGTLHVACRDPHQRDWLTQRLPDLVARGVTEALGAGVKVVFEVRGG